MKKILIPIDCNLNSEEAIEYSIKFFRSTACEFYFINTYTNEMDELNALSILKADDERFEKPKADSEKSLGTLIQKYSCNKQDKKHHFSAISECTGLIEGVKKAIKEIEIDLVVLSGKNDTKNISEKYSKNTKRIIENVRECPVMIIPSSAKLEKQPRFVLVSNFKEEIPKAELQSWYELVAIVKGKIKIITLSGKNKMTSSQKANQKRVRFQIETDTKNPIEVEYLDTVDDLKFLVNFHSDYIICLLDKKPDFWRICGFTKSRIANLGPLKSTPLIALHC